MSPTLSFTPASSSRTPSPQRHRRTGGEGGYDETVAMPNWEGHQRSTGSSQPHHHHQPSEEYPLLRLRADSNGSMRGAFTSQQRPVHMPSPHHVHPHPHHNHHPSYYPHYGGPPYSEGNTTTTGTPSPRRRRQEQQQQGGLWRRKNRPQGHSGQDDKRKDWVQAWVRNLRDDDEEEEEDKDGQAARDAYVAAHGYVSDPTHPPTLASSGHTRHPFWPPNQYHHQSLNYSQDGGSTRDEMAALLTTSNNSLMGSSLLPPWTHRHSTEAAAAPAGYPPYGAVAQPSHPPPQQPLLQKLSSRQSKDESLLYDGEVEMEGDEYNEDQDAEEEFDDDFSSQASSQVFFWEEPWYWCTVWIGRQLRHGVRRDKVTGNPYFPASAERSLAGLIRHYLFNPISPEFTSLQQFCWAVVIGIIMGVYTAVWKIIIETGVDIVWVRIPEFLLEHGLFTEPEGWFPLYHYMWIIPSLFGAVLSYIFVVLPVKIPGQNEWIASLHKSGVQDYRTFWPLFLLSTLGMLSGLSLGPELPLVLTSGMFGSWLGLICRQSMLQARVLNLTAASAAIGGFFGFPMAGALFVLELPHRSGLQYFEALTPATISSIVAVITNRLIVNNDVTGYFKYPFLATSLPSSIFWHAIIYGVFGCAIGSLYLYGVLWLKTWVHDWFHAPHEPHQDDPSIHDNIEGGDKDGVEAGYDAADTDPSKVKDLDDIVATETSPTVADSTESDALLATKKYLMVHATEKESLFSCIYSLGCLVIPHEPYRAALAGALAGFICGWVAIFVPHTLFWGEAQLQNLIDKGRTALPVFGDSTGDMVALGYCIIDPSDPAAITAGFSVGCAALISISKTVVIGISLGTGIIGGHFWGPLFVGCAASHFFSDIVNIIARNVGIGGELAAYPCLVILCTMGAAHVVSFRAHTAIMLILTLTISAFSPEDGNPYYGIAGDYSAVFPLLVISVSMSMILSRDMIFYKEQRNRGDILAVPQVLCEPGMEGQPLVAAAFESDEDGSDNEGPYDEVASVQSSHHDDAASGPHLEVRSVPNEMTMEDIEESFQRTAAYRNAPDPNASQSQASVRASSLPPAPVRPSPTGSIRKAFGVSAMSPTNSSPKPTGPVPAPLPTTASATTVASQQLSSSRLDELLAMPLERGKPSPKTGRKKSLEFHRRTNSLPNTTANIGPQGPQNLAVAQPSVPNRSRANSSSRQDLLVRVSSFGEVTEHAPSLLEQARMQAASIGHRRVPSLTRGRSSRKNSATTPSELGVDSGALSLDDIEQSFNNVVNSRSSLQGNIWS